MLKRLGLILAGLAGLTLFVLLALPWLLPRPGVDSVMPAQPFADSRFAMVDGTRLHYRARLAGDAPIVVLLHGFGGSSFSWRHSLDALEQAGLRALAIDLPPFGYSERRGDGPDWPSLVLGLIDQVDADAQLMLVGHSMGAGVAAAVAARVPERADKLVLVAGPPRLRGGGGLGPTWTVRVPSLARWEDIIAARQLIGETRIANMLSSAFGRPPTAEEVAGYRDPLAIPGTAPALRYRLSRPAPEVGDWSRVPTALIWGDADRWVPLQIALDLLDEHPDLPLLRMADAGHNPMDTEPERFNALLLDVLAPPSVEAEVFPR